MSKLVWDLDEKEKYNLISLINKKQWKKILKRYNPRKVDLNGNNLLHMACIRGDEKAIDEIIKYDPNLFYIANVYGETCSHLLLKNNWHHLFQKYYSIYPDIITFINNQGQNIAQIIIDQPVILQWLINKIPAAYKDSMNNLTIDGQTLLAQLVKITSGKDVYFEIIQDLLKMGININAGSVPPLTYATINNNIDIAQLLLKYGANPNIRNQLYMTPLIYSVNNKNPFMTRLLLKNGANINYGGPEGDELPVNIAIKNKDKKTFDVLMRNNPDLNIVDRKLNTPLHYLSRSLSEDKKNWIEPSKAFRVFFNGDLDKKNIKGETPRKLLRESPNQHMFSRLINSNKSIHREQKTRLLPQSKMINFLENASNNEINRQELLKKCNTKYEINKCKSLIKKHILEGNNLNRTNKELFLPESEEASHGLFNSDIVHNCIYTIIFLKKFENLMIPTQSYIEDIVNNELQLIKDYNSYRSPFGQVLCDLLYIYNEFIYEIVPHLLIWRDKNIYNFHKNLKILIKDLLDSTKIRFIYLKLTLIPHVNGTHANLLLYDKKTQELIRFEPYGYMELLDDDILNKKLQELGKEIFGEKTKYYKPKDYLKDHRFQVVSDDTNDNNKKLGDPVGYCLAWCFWFMEYRINNPDIPINKLISHAFDTIKNGENTTNKFLDYIRNYATKLNDEKDKIMEEIGIPDKEIYDLTHKDHNIEKINKYLIEQISKIKKMRLESFS
jgi:ankyrin repeat protein